VLAVTLITSGIFLYGVQSFSPQLVFLRSNFFYVASFTVFLVFTSWNMLVDSVFLAFRAAGYLLLRNTIISVSKLFFPFAFIVLGAYGIFTSTSLAFTLGVVVSLIILSLKFNVRFSLSINTTIIKETMTYSFANYISSFVLNMPSLILPVIILNVLSAKYVAYYYVASMIQNMLQVVPVAAEQALLTEGSYNEAELRKHIKKALTTILVILTPAIAVIVLLGNVLLQAFGKSYASEAFPFLQLYSASTLFTALLLISNAIMNIKRQVVLMVIWNVISSLLTLGLSYAFISGKLIGIGWGWMLGQVITGAISLIFIAHSYWKTPPPSNTAEIRAN
jgi:O-antigen/teichoic acid export membrane protein